MGHSISQATHERIERYRAQDRLCQMGSRCSQRAVWKFVERVDGTFETERPVGEIGEFKFCKRHGDEQLRTLDAYGKTCHGYEHVSHERF